MDCFCPLWQTNINQFLIHAHYALPTTLGSSSHLTLVLHRGSNLGRGAHARARWLRNKTYFPEAESSVKKVVFLNENENSGKTLAR